MKLPSDECHDKSTLVQVMAWCRQATSHYLSQCWPRSMLPNGVTRPQWVKFFILDTNNQQETKPQWLLINTKLIGIYEQMNWTILQETMLESTLELVFMKCHCCLIPCRLILMYKFSQYCSYQRINCVSITRCLVCKPYLKEIMFLYSLFSGHYSILHNCHAMCEMLL